MIENIYTHKEAAGGDRRVQLSLHPFAFESSKKLQYYSQNFC